MTNLLTMSSASLLMLTAALEANAENIEISGSIEVDANFSSSYNNVDTSDITLSTVQLGIDGKINDHVTGHISLLHEEDATPLEVDEGTITLDIGRGWSVTAGQMYLPFGSYESNMVSDPLTLSLGETRESAVMLGYEANGFYGSVYAFNGDTSKASTPVGEDKIEHSGASIGYMVKTDTYSLNLGLDYISSLGDSDGLSASLPDANADGLPDALTSFVGGTALHAVYNRDALSVILEYISSDDFKLAELGFNGKGASPSAFNIEAGYGFDWGTAALGYQATDEALALGLPESRILVALSKEIYDDTALSFEYAVDSDYSTTVGGTGKDASSTTIQLAVSF